MSELAGAEAEAVTEEFDYIEQEPPPPPAALPAGEEEVVLGEPVVESESKWEEEAVREHLKMVGSGVHELWGKAEKDWEMSERDLERIAPPLTRILNRYEPTARLAIASDPILLGYGTTMYTYRSVLQARAAMAAQREAAEKIESDPGTYEQVPSRDAPRNGRPSDSVLRFPEAARGATQDEGE